MAKDRAKDVLHGHEGSYALLDIIGKGAYGTVYKGIWREAGRHVAVKRVLRTRLSSDEKKALQDEIFLFKNLKHSHIVNYIEAIEDNANDSDYLDIVMEFVEGGSLFNMVDSIRRSLDPGERVFEESVVSDLVRQVLLGLQYLHHQGVVHRDIKGANLLITKERHVKLADFGVASTKPADPSSPIDVAGSPYWMAPEIITLTGSSTASDIWSLGCTVIELITGLPPYHQYEDITALFKIVSDDCPPLPSNLSADCEDFLRKCFNKDVHARATADELLLHRWVVRVSEHVVTELDDWEEEEEEDNDEPVAQPTGSPVLASDSLATTQLGLYEEDEDDNYDDIEFGLPESSVGDAAFRASSSSETFGVSIGIDSPPVLSPPPPDMGGNPTSVGELGASSSENKSGGGPVARGMSSSTSFRDDPFKGLMDDPEVHEERERLRKQKELWQIVKDHVANLGKDEDAHVAACEGLMDLFKTNPEQRYNLIYDPGLLPIIEVLEGGGGGNKRVVETMLHVTLSFLDEGNADKTDSEFDGDNSGGSRSSNFPSLGYPRVSNIREDLCLAGFLPVVMRYCNRNSSFTSRILAARFLHKMLELERVLDMFVACRGFSVFVDMLEPDILSAGELSRIALDGIHKLLTMDNQRHKRDFCRRFAWGGLLGRIIDGISYSAKHIKTIASNGDSRKGSDEIRADFLRHVAKLASLLETFAARADPTVKARMTTGGVLETMIGLIENRLMPKDAIQSILCAIRDLSRDPQTHEALQTARTIETLVNFLSEERECGLSEEHFIISSLHNLCIVSTARQESVVRAGFVPYLQRIILSKDMNTRSLCIDMYSGLACASHATRVELGKHDGVDFYVELMVQLCAPGTVRRWQARVLQSFYEWLEDEELGVVVEKRLAEEHNRQRFCESLAQMRLTEVEAILEPYYKMVSKSLVVNRVFGSSQQLIVTMVRWLESMYGRLGSGCPARSRLLLLRTLLAHTKVWKNDPLMLGVATGLHVLLEEVVLVVETAITAREQAMHLSDVIKKITK